MKTALILLISAAAAYLLGCINGAILTSRFFFREDVREKGSGNAGLTNFYRVYGVKGMALVIAIDMLKTVLGVLLGRYLLGTFLSMPVVGAYWAGLWVILGHSYPCMFKFHGGKGILCAAGGLIVIDPLVFAFYLAVSGSAFSLAYGLGTGTLHLNAPPVSQLYMAIAAIATSIVAAACFQQGIRRHGDPPCGGNLLLGGAELLRHTAAGAVHPGEALTEIVVLLCHGLFLLFVDVFGLIIAHPRMIYKSRREIPAAAAEIWIWSGTSSAALFCIRGYLFIS